MAIRIHRVMTILTVTAVALVVGYAVTCVLKYQYGHDYQFGLVQLLDLDGENNLPSWYSSGILLLCSAILLVTGHGKKQIHDPYARHWLALSVIFLFLSLDEGASLHERLLEPTRQRFHLTGYLFYAWVVPAGALVVVLALSYLRFLMALPESARLGFLFAGATYLLGALGMEMISGNQVSLYGEAITNTPGHSVLIGIEEGLEMAGILIFMRTLLMHAARHASPVSITFVSRASPGPRRKSLSSFTTS